MEEIQKLKEKRDKLNLAINNLEYEHTIKVSIPILRKSIGRCFTYMNSYGGSDYNRKYWPIYIKIVDIDEKDMSFTTLEFQKMSDDRIEIKFANKWNFDGENYFDKSGDYTEIKRSEFEKARNEMLKIVQKLLA